MVEGDKKPIYEETLEDVRRFNENPALPFNAFGTLAMARAEFDANSGSSQVFFLLKVSPSLVSCTCLTPAFCSCHCMCWPILLLLVIVWLVSVSVEACLFFPLNVQLHAVQHDQVLPWNAQMCDQISRARLMMQESELTPTGANLLDGRYAVFGYVVDGADLLTECQAGDMIEYIKVTDGGQYLQMPVPRPKSSSGTI